MKRILSLALCLGMLASLLAGCGGEAGVSTAEASAPASVSAAEISTPAPATEPAAEAASATEASSAEEELALPPINEVSIENPYTFPLVDRDMTVTMWCDIIPPLFNSMPNGMADNSVYQELQKRTGVTLDITSTASTSASDQVRLIVASGDFPDIWNGFAAYYTGGLEEAVDEDLILDLAEYKEDFPSYFSIVDGYDVYRQSAYTDTGKMGVLSGIWTNHHIDSGLAIRKDWFEALNMEVPTTLEGFHDLLTMFHDQYGATYYMNQASGDPANAFSQCFGVVGHADDRTAYAYYYAKDGEDVTFGPTEPGFKDYVSTMAQWYQEGLIYPDFVSATDNQASVDQLLGGEIGVTYYTVSNYSTLLGQVPDGDTFELMAVDVPLDNETGENVHLGRAREYIATKGFSLSSSLQQDVEKFDAVSQMLDYLYTDEGTELCNYGVEDYTFTYGENGEHIWTDLMVNNPDLAYSWCLNRYTLGMGSFRIDSTRTMNNYGDQEMALMDVWDCSENDAADMLPATLSLTGEEAAAFSATFSDIRTYVQQNILEFIIGSKPMDSYDAFVEEIQSMGIEDCTAILQDALERYHQR